MQNDKKNMGLIAAIRTLVASLDNCVDNKVIR
jgi:hypothetical protein